MPTLRCAGCCPAAAAAAAAAVWRQFSSKFNGLQGGQPSHRSMVPGSYSYSPTTTLQRAGGGALHCTCTQPLPTASAGVDDLNLMERDLLSCVTGDSGRQRLQGQGRDQDPRPPPSPTLSLRVGTDDTNRGHGREPQQAQAPAANVVSQLPSSSSRVQFAPDGRRLASVVVPGYPMSERRHNLRAVSDGTAAGTPVQEQRTTSSAAPGPAPRRPPMAPPVSRTLELAVAGPTVTTGAGPGPGQEHCDACGISAMLLQGLSGDLDRARAQVALLTCQNESLRHRLKRASAAEAGPECPAAASAPAPQLNLRCGACGVRPATVLLVPREHLCLCGHCANSSRNGGAALACPVCRGGVGTWLAEAAGR